MEKTSSRRQVNKSVSRIVISAMMIALATILNFIFTYIPGLQWPNGGSITIAVLPIYVNGLICGPIWGVVSGVIYGIIDMLIGGAWVYNWCSILLDYIVGFGVLGLAGVFSKQFYQKKVWGGLAGITLGSVLRFIASFFSGCLVMWDVNYNGELAPDFSSATVTYSLVYNLGYILPTMVLCMIVYAIIAKPLATLIKQPVVRNASPYSKQLEEGTFEESGSLNKLTFDDCFLPIVLVLTICSALACIPQSIYENVNFLALGYVGMIGGFSFFVYALVRFIMIKIGNSSNETGETGIVSRFGRKDVFYLVSFLVSLIPVAVGILSLCLNYIVFPVVE